MTYDEEGDVTGTYKDLEQNDHYKLEFEDQEQVFKIVRDKYKLIVSDADGSNSCTYKQGEPENK